MPVSDARLLSIHRPALDRYNAIAQPSIIVESYCSAPGHMTAQGCLHRISLNRTRHRRYAYRYGSDAYRTVERPAMTIGFQPANTTLEVEGDDADYISIYQAPSVYDAIKGGVVGLEALSDGSLTARADPPTLHAALCLAEIARQPALADPMMVEHLGIGFACCVTRLLGAWPQSGQSRLSAAQMRRVIDYIEDALDRPTLCVADLAKLACLSSFHFSRAFKAATGIAPHQFVLKRRVRYAQVLIADGGASLAQIAYETGFSSQAHFAHTFKRMTGHTPGQYRKSAGL